MIEDYYEGYKIRSFPRETRNGKWAVSITIYKSVDGKIMEKQFYADDKIRYILEIEAAKEGINLGKNLIKANRVRF